MRRRPFLTAVATGLALPIGGCSTASEPDLEQIKRLGAAPPLSLRASSGDVRGRDRPLIYRPSYTSSN